MNPHLLFDFTVDKKNNNIKVKREFEASVDLVWASWTTPELLDLWWAPKPYYNKTISMDFREGGSWLYSMIGPDGTTHYCRADYQKIIIQKYFKGLDAFCDKDGKINEDFARSDWEVSFAQQGATTMVDIQIHHQKLEDLEKYIEMGFKEGFTAALENLDQYIAAQFKLRSQLKNNIGARTTTYLNFPGNTEEAFNFYKTVFGTEFSGKGIQRFGEIPADSGHPPVAEVIKNMILHVELPILGNHILMATDAPKEMGFNLTTGNNMHICLEPETKAETKRLFDALSNGGTITMPLEVMFFGAYFGECTDRFGINWMFNCWGE